MIAVVDYYNLHSQWRRAWFDYTRVVQPFAIAGRIASIYIKYGRRLVQRALTAMNGR